MFPFPTWELTAASEHATVDDSPLEHSEERKQAVEHGSTAQGVVAKW